MGLTLGGEDADGLRLKVEIVLVHHVVEAKRLVGLHSLALFRLSLQLQHKAPKSVKNIHFENFQCIVLVLFFLTNLFDLLLNKWYLGK